MGQDNVLFEILNTLHRLETRLDGHKSRIGSIEHSVHPGTSHSTSEFSCSFNPSTTASTATEEQGPRSSPAAPLSPSPSFKADSPTPEMYQAAVMSLRKRFEFINDSQSKFQGVVQSWPQMRPEVPMCAGNGSAIWNDNDEGGITSSDGHDDAYTQSVYSSRPLSRCELNIPPAVPVLEKPKSTPVSEEQGPRGSYPCGTPLPESHVQEREMPLRKSKRSISWRRGKDHASHVSEPPSRQPSHERAKISYYACDNFVYSLHASRSFRSEERRAILHEIKRLGSLSSPEEDESWASTLRRAFLGLFRRLRPQRLDAIHFIA